MIEWLNNNKQCTNEVTWLASQGASMTLKLEDRRGETWQIVERETFNSWTIAKLLCIFFLS